MKIRDILAIMAVALTAVGCNQQDDGLQQDERVPILLKATVNDAAKGPTHTRAATTATTQNTEFLNGQKVKVWIKENDGSHTAWIKNPIEYKVVNDYDDDDDDGDLDPVTDTTPFFFPVGVNTISMYGVHPSSYTSGSDFIVATDQTSDADYAASDLCYSSATNHTSSAGPVDTNGRQVVTFQHALSKIVVNITTNTGKQLPTTVKLLAKTTTKMTWSTGSDFSVQAEATGDASYITMGLNPNTAGDKVSGGAIIPPQTIADGTSFISFTVADLGPMIYPLPANTTFTSGKRYTYNIKVNNVGITATTDIDDWGTTVNGGIVMGQPGEEYKKNPLWWVGEYNLSLASNNTTFSLDHTASTSQGTLFQWTSSDAVANHGIMATKYAASSSGYNGWQLPTGTGKTASDRTLEGVAWHLPTFQEMQSIVPSSTSGTATENIFSNTLYAAGGGLITEGECVFGYNATSQTAHAYQSYWSPYNDDSKRYAIRFLGSEFCSVWKYEFITNVGLYVTSKLIDKIEATNTTALAAKMTEITAASYDWTNLNENVGEIKRLFNACGWENTTYRQSAAGTSYIDVCGYYWTATHATNHPWRMQFSSNTLRSYEERSNLGFSVRLFRDN